MIVGAGFKPARNRNNDQTETSVNNNLFLRITKGVPPLTIIDYNQI